MKLIVNTDDVLRRLAKDMVKLKGLTPQEASERTGVPVADILREYEEPSPLFTSIAPDGTVEQHGRE
jgi:hypothetical protein